MLLLGSARQQPHTGPASTGRGRDRVPRRHGTTAGQSVGPSADRDHRPCNAPSANIAPLCSLAAAFSNSSRAVVHHVGRHDRSPASPPAQPEHPLRPPRLPGQPGPCARKIRLDAASLGQHAAVHVLGLRHTFGSALQQYRCVLLVSLDTHSLGQAEPKIEGSNEVAGSGGLLKPRCDPNRVFPFACACRDWPSPPALILRRPRRRHEHH